MPNVRVSEWDGFTLIYDWTSLPFSLQELQEAFQAGGELAKMMELIEVGIPKVREEMRALAGTVPEIARNIFYGGDT